MRLSQIVRNDRGTAGNWRVHPRAVLDNGELSEDFAELWHYQTRMLVWNRQTREVYDWSTGHGSQSDQNGLNQAFAVLGARYYYSRAGGAAIRELDKPNFRYGLSAA
jgi:hypothetical protein